MTENISYSSKLSTSLSFLDLIFISIFFLVINTFLKLLGRLYNELRFILKDDLCKEFTSHDDRPSDGPYPNGWMPVAESNQFCGGKVLKTHALGQNIVLVRDSRGKVHAVESNCPNSGDHLGHGEIIQVRGEDSIRCPFHEWSFRLRDGACVDASNAKDWKALEGRSIKVWPCIEVNGFICVWHQSKGNDPDWYPDELRSNQKDYSGKIEYILSTSSGNNNNIMIGGNIIDLSDLSRVPDKPLSFGRKIAQYFGFKGDVLELTFELLSCTTSKKPDNHKRILEYRGSLKILSFQIATGYLHSHRCGPSLSTIQFDIKIFGLHFTQEMTLGLTFIDKSRQKFVFQMYTDRGISSRIMCRLIRIFFYYAIGEDCSILQDMVCFQKLGNSKKDKSLIELHRWSKQFYDAAGGCHLRDVNDW
ncbi:cholesterol 7-desaturase nvd-like [Brevipalpus obovatus]|uniref:cholesterol 7-desaturase nvd-like n=1 Tax=Brevipalpus obovatus TaxID=246614 RepID=UPI003D9F75A4